MKTFIITTTLMSAILVTALAASANTYVNPNAPFNAEAFFRSIPTGQ